MVLRLWSVYNIFLLFLFMSCPDNGFAMRVFSENELREKIIQGSVREMYISDAGIEGTFDDDGTITPFMIFGDFAAKSDELRNLAKKHGVKFGYKHIVKSPTGNGMLTSLVMQFAISAIFLSALCGILFSLLLINKKMKKIILLLGDNKEQKG